MRVFNNIEIDEIIMNSGLVKPKVLNYYTQPLIDSNLATKNSSIDDFPSFSINEESL